MIFLSDVESVVFWFNPSTKRRTGASRSWQFMEEATRSVKITADPCIAFVLLDGNAKFGSEPSQQNRYLVKVESYYFHPVMHHVMFSLQHSLETALAP